MAREDDRTLLLCLSPVGRQWELGSIADLPMPHWLIGWPAARRTDAGVPAPVRQVLTAALTTLAPVAFLTSSTPNASEPYAGGFLLSRIRREIGRRFAMSGPDACWRRERLAQAAESLFDHPVFAWTLRAQLACVCAADVALPAPSQSFVDAMLDEDWTDQLPGLFRHGVQAVLRPGVDGDVALLVSATTAVEARIRDALVRAATATGVRLCELSEEDFAQRQGEPPHGTAAAR